VCFSAEADVAAGVIIGAIGLDGIRHVRRRAELALAALPLILAGHQFVEAFVWWGLEGHVPQSIGRFAIWLYLAVAFGVFPVLVPIAVAALEPAATRRRMTPFVVIGAVVAAVLSYAVVRGPIVAAIEGHHITYEADLWHGGVTVAHYVMATCGPMLLSAWPHVRWFGRANLVAAAALAWLSQSSFISLWCLWAAVTSVVITSHLRMAASTPHRAHATRP
jgi:hypothetical protein